MSDIEKIKAEIERQRSFIEGLFIEGDSTFYDGQDDAYNHLLAFIDSLPEETCKENTDSFTSLKKRDDLALTWQDVAILISIYEQEVEAGNISRYEDEGAPSLQEASEIILKRFKEIRKK